QNYKGARGERWGGAEAQPLAAANKHRQQFQYLSVGYRIGPSKLLTGPAVRRRLRVNIQAMSLALYCSASAMPAPSSVSLWPSRGHDQRNSLPQGRSAAACSIGVASFRR